SSTRTCFIAYGFKTSPMEMTILRNLLERRGIQCEEAGGQLAPGQSAFCQKICSKIITSQFCIVLLNHDEKEGQLIPNANVNMEYGLILGFNKYLIPFQREKHSLPFNVAGLDTVKYSDQDFERKASSAIDIAIEKTTQDFASSPTPDQIIEIFLLSKKYVFANIDNPGEKAIFLLGSTFGFRLLNDFSGMTYHFFGNFTNLRPEIIIWRLKMFNELLNARKNSIKNRIELELMTSEQSKFAESLFTNLKILILLTSDDSKASVLSNMKVDPFSYPLEIYSIEDIKKELDRLEKDLS
ncbi:MAG TPA: TIR domain-containing protein, partial [Desulfobacterales bacterium]|nr:TIR domain-containing protein [Desulfobacterales bacterium]